MPKELDDLDLKLRGLKALADQHERDLRRIIDTARELTGDEDEYGVTSDWLRDPDDQRSPSAVIALVLK